jgi:hypothetical protein
MDSSPYKGFSLIDGHRTPTGPTDCYLMKIAYQPNPDFYAAVGFALFEAKDEPRKTAIRFAPRLDLIESIHTSSGGQIWETILRNAQPAIRSLVASAVGPHPTFFPQNFNIPRDLKIFRLIELQVDDFDQEVDRLSHTIFGQLTLWAEYYNWQQPKTFGFSYLSQRLSAAFRKLLRRPGLDKRIPVGKFLHDDRRLNIHLAYEDRQNNTYRMLQPVSILNSRQNAYRLARDWPYVRDGLQNEKGFPCELSAIVEGAELTSKSRIESCRRLEDAGIIVAPVSSLSDIVRRAELALRFV